MLWTRRRLSRKGGGPRAAGQWHHYCLVYDDGNATLYYDSVVQKTTKIALNTSNSSPFHLGAGLDGADALDGSIDEVYIYEEALTQDAIDLIYSRDEPAFLGAVAGAVLDAVVGTDIAADGRPDVGAFTNAVAHADDGRAHVWAVGAADGRADAGDARAHGRAQRAPSAMPTVEGLGVAGTLRVVALPQACDDAAFLGAVEAALVAATNASRADVRCVGYAWTRSDLYWGRRLQGSEGEGGNTPETAVPTSVPTSNPSALPPPKPSRGPTAVPTSTPSSVPTASPAPTSLEAFELDYRVHASYARHPAIRAET